jgi:alkylation response protein AidB-like acyl-CoA dehydrogenase
MNFDWTPEQSGLREALTGLLDDEARARLEALETTDETGVRETLTWWQARAAKAGYLAPAADPMALLAAQEELATVSSACFLAVETSARLFGGLIVRHAPSLLQADILPLLAGGRTIGAVAVSEPGDVKPVSGPRTTAVRDGDEFVVTGRKDFVTNGPVADYVAVSAMVEGRPAVCIFEPGTGPAGFRRGDRLTTLGQRGLAVCGLDLDRARVPASRVLGPFDDDGPLNDLRTVQDLILSVAALGLMRRVIDEVNAYCRTYHRGAKPIYAHQEVRFKLADMVTLYQTARLLTCRAAWLTAIGDREARTVLECAKVFDAESAEKLASLALQIEAGQGYLAGTIVERAWRDAKYAALAGTTSEKSRMGIADAVLRRYQV